MPDGGTPEPLGETLHRLLAEGYPKMRDAGYGSAAVPPFVADDPTVLRITQAAGWLPASCCVMTDSTGENHCKHPPPPPIPWRRRAKWRLRSWWSGLRMRVGSWVAGVDLDDRDEW